MGALADVFGRLRDALTEWRNVRLGNLQFPHQHAARLTLIVLIGLSLTLIVVRLALGGTPGRSRIALPRILPWIRQSPLAFVRHAPLVPFLIGLAFFAVALAGAAGGADDERGRSVRTRRDVASAGNRRRRNWCAVSRVRTDGQ